MIFKQVTPPSVVLILLLAAADHYGGARQTAGKSQRMIVVEASYPGANATVVAEAVAAPIEQQVILCEDLFEQGRKESKLSTEYRLTWLQEIPAQK